jgi:exoribonuclease R
VPVPPFVIEERAPELVEGLARIREELEVPGPHPPDAEAEAVQAARRTLEGLEASAGRDRVDARDVAFVTIDPEGSRDLDQALHLERLPGGGHRVRYAIADLAAFVTPGGPLDSVLWGRGVTYYLPDERAPLHPPVLGEGAASLLPEQDRPAVLWTIDLDRDGLVTRVRFERAVVRSRAQLTYVGVQAALDAGRAGETEQLLAEVGPKRQAIEADRGGVSLDLPTQRVVDEGDRWRLQREHVVPVMGWNAQISLLAGMTAAEAMLEAGTGLLRTLPPPTTDVMRRVRASARALDVDWPANVGYAGRVRRLDGDVPAEAALLVLAARGLRGAGYLALVPGEPAPGGDAVLHGAVAAPYAHVTAPLRRLCDRHANEVCLALFSGAEPSEGVIAQLADLPKAMAQARGREGSVARAVVDLVEALLLRAHVGRTLAATVVASHDERSTVVVADPAVQADVPGELPLGERVEVRVEAADPATRTIELRIA